LAKELDAVAGKLEKSFKLLATYLTELKMDGIEKLDPKNAKLVGFLGCIDIQILEEPASRHPFALQCPWMVIYSRASRFNGSSNSQKMLFIDRYRI
jgi:hypothetical protein